MKLNYPMVALILGLAVIAISIWNAQRNKIHFDLFDLVMENGKVSKTAVAFMLVLAVTTWVVVVLVYKDKMTEGYLGLYGAMWVTPLVARVVFSKPDAPSVSTFTTTTESRVVEPSIVKETP